MLRKIILWNDPEMLSGLQQQMTAMKLKKIEICFWQLEVWKSLSLSGAQDLMVVLKLCSTFQTTAYPILLKGNSSKFCTVTN